MDNNVMDGFMLKPRGRKVTSTPLGPASTPSSGVIISDIDTRMRIDPATSQPYVWICSIIAAFSDNNGKGITKLGTGFLLNIPESTTYCILTAGNILCDQTTSKIARYVEYQFPGDVSTRIEGHHIRVSSGFLKSPATSVEDYGIICLPTPIEIEGFGYSVTIPDDKILASTASLFGYSENPFVNDPRYILGSGGEITSVSATQLQHTIDVSKGAVGAPVFIWSNGYWTVVGIQVRGHKDDTSTYNIATRLTLSVIEDILSWTGNPLYQAKQIISDAYPNSTICLRILQPDPQTGKVLIVAHFNEDPQDITTKFQIIPLASYPIAAYNDTSSEPPQKVSCAVKSRGSMFIKNGYFSMDTTGVNTDITSTGSIEALPWTNITAMKFELSKLELRRVLKTSGDQPIYMKIDGTGLTPMVPDGLEGSAGAKIVSTGNDFTFCKFNFAG